MAIGLMGGLGRALVEGANQMVATDVEERDRKRREGIQDQALARQKVMEGRQDQEWARQQDTLAGQDTATDQLINQHLDPTWNPAEQFWKHSQAWNAPAPGAAGPTREAAAQPSPLPSPVAGLPTVTSQPKGLWSVTPAGLKTGQPTGTPAPAPASQPQAQAPQAVSPMPQELQEISQGYKDTIERPLQTGIARLQAEGKDTPAARRALYEAITGTAKAKDLDAKMNGFVEETKQAAVAARARAAGRAITSHDPAAIQSIFGQGAKWGINPDTGLQAVRMPDGTFVGSDVAMAQSFLNAGVIDQKEYTRLYVDAANNANKLMIERENNAAKKDLKSMPNISVHIAGGGQDANKEIQKANEAYNTGKQQYLLDHPGDAQGAERAGLAAKQGILSAGATRANAYEERTKDLHLENLEKARAARLKSAYDSSVGKDTFTGERKPVQDAQGCLNKWKELQKSDPELAIRYATNLLPEQTSLIQAEVEKMGRQVKDQDQGDVKGKGNPFQKAKGKAPDAGTLKSARDAIAAGADKAAVLKRLEDNGFDSSVLGS